MAEFAGVEKEAPTRQPMLIGRQQVVEMLEDLHKSIEHFERERVERVEAVARLDEHLLVLRQLRETLLDDGPKVKTFSNPARPKEF